MTSEMAAVNRGDMLRILFSQTCCYQIVLPKLWCSFTLLHLQWAAKASKGPFHTVLLGRFVSFMDQNRSESVDLQVM